MLFATIVAAAAVQVGSVSSTTWMLFQVFAVICLTFVSAGAAR